ncbi:predicted protein [Botrytis cinerea T4]|uniref:Uncharacterized protein n=1 Tax=Botryotinia fuckeliana (strain T4) TaxID=999810 RepID=G2XVU2_BOTF4|nr:predicted protein [Botrytis cinerea T4]
MHKALFDTVMTGSLSSSRVHAAERFSALKRSSQDMLLFAIEPPHCILKISISLIIINQCVYLIS